MIPKVLFVISIILTICSIIASSMTINCYYNNKKIELEESNIKYSLSANIIFGLVLIALSIYYIKKKY